MFSVEALSAFTIIIILIASLPLNERYSNKELFAEQKARDLLTVWARENTGESEMTRDAKIFLGEKNFQIRLNGKIMGKELKAGVAAEEILIFENKKISILVGEN